MKLNSINLFLLRTLSGGTNLEKIPTTQYQNARKKNENENKNNTHTQAEYAL